MKTIKLPAFYDDIRTRFPDHVLWFLAGYGYEAFDEDADLTASSLGRSPLVAEDGHRLVWVSPYKSNDAHKVLLRLGHTVKLIGPAGKVIQSKLAELQNRELS